MKNAMLLSALFATLTLSIGARAADTTELKVKGSVKPPSCTLNLAAGGVIDYGNIPPSRLSNTAATKLERRTTAFNIDCATGKAMVALKLSDNRASSVVPAIMSFSNGYKDDNFAYGLGIVDGKKVGIYTVSMTKVQADGYNIALYLNRGLGSDPTIWNNAYSSNGAFFRPTLIYTWAPNDPESTRTAAQHAPGAFSTVAGELTVEVTIDKLANLPVRDAIPLDGSSTLELVYL